MSIWDNVKRFFVSAPEKRELNENSAWGMIAQNRSIYQYDSYAGPTVTPAVAMQSAAVYACVRVLSETVASLPLILYRRLPNGGKERATNHPLYTLLHDLSNDDMTSLEVRELMMGNLCLWGNAYAQIMEDQAGRIAALYPLRADQMSIYLATDGELSYIYRAANGTEIVLPEYRVWHVRGMSSNGIIGQSPIQTARQAIGLAMATEQFGARFFSNGARPGMILQHPGHLTDEAYKRLIESWEQRHAGAENSHKTALLEEGMTAKEVGIPPEDAQFLQTREFQLEEIARIYRIPLHMIGDLKHSTFSNIEHMGIEFVTHTLRPWLVRIEQSITRCLLTPAERKEYFAEFLVDGLLRGDIMSRYQAYATGRQNGWLSANDVRSMENMNPVEGGDVYLTPLNMASVGGMDDKNVDDTTDDSPDNNRARRSVTHKPEYRAKVIAPRRKLMDAYKPVFQDTARRIIHREAVEINKAAKKYFSARSQADFDQWVEEFYKDQKDYAMRQMTPVMQSYGEAVAASVQTEVDGKDDQETLKAFDKSYIEDWSNRHVQKSQEKLAKAIERAPEDPIDEIEAEMQTWEADRPQNIAMNETNRQGNAVAKLIYIAAGITILRWYAAGSASCPYCQRMDGKIAGIDKWFLAAGEDYKPEGADSPLKTSSNIGHPPLHEGCECIVGAG